MFHHSSRYLKKSNIKGRVILTQFVRFLPMFSALHCLGAWGEGEQYHKEYM